MASAPRYCDLCGEQFMPAVWHQRFCSALCSERARSPVERLKYRGQQERRRAWVARVATGTVRCARGAACRFGDGELGGLIAANALWDLGHPDGESVGGPEHRECNRSAPQRLKARRWREW